MFHVCGNMAMSGPSDAARSSAYRPFRRFSSGLFLAASCSNTIRSEDIDQDTFGSADSTGTLSQELVKWRSRSNVWRVAGLDHGVARTVHEKLSPGFSTRCVLAVTAS